MAVDLTKNNDSNWEIAIDGKMVSRKQLVTAWKFYQKMQLSGGESECPLCGCDLRENHLFCCEECAEILPLEEECQEHNLGICRECCEECRDNKAYEEAANAKIDEMRGK